jgi:hypothetical protein
MYCQPRWQIFIEPIFEADFQAGSYGSATGSRAPGPSGAGSGPAKTITMQSPWGELEMVGPVAQLSETKAYWELPPAPFGSHKPEWDFEGGDER